MKPGAFHCTCTSEVVCDICREVGWSLQANGSRVFTPTAWVWEHPPAKEAVNRPSHYDLGVGQDLQVMDLVEAQAAGLSGFDGFLLGNVLKYVLRFQRKGQPLQDLKKARHYLDLLISKTESASEPPGETLE